MEPWGGLEMPIALDYNITREGRVGSHTRSYNAASHARAIHVHTIVS